MPIDHEDHARLHSAIKVVENAEFKLLTAHKNEDTSCAVKSVINALDRAKSIASEMLDKIENKVNKAPHQISVKVYDLGGIDCLEGSCPFKKECANHETAGDFRSEDGFTPELYKEGEVFFCKTKNKPANAKYPELPFETKGNGSLIIKNSELVIHDDRLEAF
jgi:hypothetical protein